MFEALRKRSAIAGLKQWLSSQKRDRRTSSLEKAAVIAIAFDATTDKTRKEVEDWAAELAKNGKKIHLLGFFNDKKAPAKNPDFPFFFAKETNWDYSPKSEKALAFIGEKADLLLVLNPKQLLPVEWIAARHKAAMKIGMHTENPHDFDLQIEIPADKGVPFFAQQLRLYLDKIK